jgi:hypothetical protein
VAFLFSKKLKQPSKESATDNPDTKFLENRDGHGIAVARGWYHALRDLRRAFILICCK